MSLKVKKDYLEQKISRLESDISNPSLANDIPNIAQNNNQIKLLTKKIKRFEAEAGNLEKEISEKRIEHRNLTQKERVSAVAFNAELKKFKELELLKNSKARGLDFSLSTMEPVNFFGPSVRTNTLLASAGGLIFMIFFTLIKDAFSPKRMDAINSGPMDTQYAIRNNDDFIQNEGLVIKSAMIVHPPKNSEPLKKPQPEYSPVFK